MRFKLIIFSNKANKTTKPKKTVNVWFWQALATSAALAALANMLSLNLTELRPKEGKAFACKIGSLNLNLLAWGVESGDSGGP
jgi:hypothetical protein